MGILWNLFSFEFGFFNKNLKIFKIDNICIVYKEYLLLFYINSFDPLEENLEMKQNLAFDKGNQKIC